MVFYKANVRRKGIHFFHTSNQFTKNLCLDATKIKQHLRLVHLGLSNHPNIDDGEVSVFGAHLSGSVWFYKKKWRHNRETLVRQTSLQHTILIVRVSSFLQTYFDILIVLISKRAKLKHHLGSVVKNPRCFAPAAKLRTTWWWITDINNWRCMTCLLNYISINLFKSFKYFQF